MEVGYRRSSHMLAMAAMSFAQLVQRAHDPRPWEREKRQKGEKIRERSIHETMRSWDPSRAKVKRRRNQNVQRLRLSR